MHFLSNEFAGLSHLSWSFPFVTSGMFLTGNGKEGAIWLQMEKKTLNPKKVAFLN